MDWWTSHGAEALILLLSAGIRLALPTALAAAGEAFCERAGVLNLALEGMMLGGALASFSGAFYGGPWVGILAGVIAGIALAALMALLSISFKTDQVVNGIAIVVLVQGLTAFIYGWLFGSTSSPPRIHGLPEVRLPLLGSIPVIGQILFSHNVLTYLSLLVIASIWWVLFRTRLGLSVRAVGESALAADASGVKVTRTRWVALLVCGAIAGMAGAVLVIGQLHLFAPNVTAGRGWIAIAIVILARWNPAWITLGALAFGTMEALQLRIQAAGGGVEASLPYEFLQILPYLLTVLVITVVSIRKWGAGGPAELGVTYEREARYWE